MDLLNIFIPLQVVLYTLPGQDIKDGFDDLLSFVTSSSTAVLALVIYFPKIWEVSLARLTGSGMMTARGYDGREWLQMNVCVMIRVVAKPLFSMHSKAACSPWDSLMMICGTQS
jgi:hypothetical protein